ncbi:SMI1/KNR4 family protein [Streptomyces justiciae]|uniref:SMI1/KNR4 family protein n=1 Tax=Streptomyces justiciae TaxID=2780140 RepID=UPI00187DE31C|nr:SMI1/KNR4 family protein [Streptomyces justiciae]MBE8477465.1 SMI1/KNR4 family protein [Streptomyces justiciae]
MEGQPLIVQLRDLMPPHEGAGDSIDWEEAERAWGAGFPQDYKEFVAQYGDGEVDAFLTFLVPEWTEGSVPCGAMAEETAEARRMWLEKPPAGYGSPATPPVVAWGVNARADLLCWMTGEQDPGLWPVAVWSRGTLAWDVHDCGMLEYLVRLFRGEIDTMWADDGVRRFVHVREAQRLLAAGINPDTGEPNPYAGMFGPPPGRSQNE